MPHYHDRDSERSLRSEESLCSSCHPDRIHGAVCRTQTVIPTEVPRLMRHAVEGSRRNPRVLPPLSLFEFLFSIFAFRRLQASPLTPF